MPAPARATVVVPADLEELVRGALAIVRARVVKVEPRLVAGPRIERRVVADVITYYKGDLGARLTFRVPGGTLGRYRTIVVGAPEYAEGEEVLLFLNADGASLPYVLGLFQGTYRVIEDAATRARVVVPAGLQATSRTQPVVRGDGSRDPMRLTAFEARLRRLVARAGAAGARP